MDNGFRLPQIATPNHTKDNEAFSSRFPLREPHALLFGGFLLYPGYCGRFDVAQMRWIDMEEPDWAKFLNYLYETQGHLYATEYAGEGTMNEYLFDELRDKIDFSDTLDSNAVFAQMLRNLDELDLIEWEQDDFSSSLRLQPKGFEVAHERELRNQQETHNRILAAFTVLVGISALVQAVSVVATESGLMQWILGFISVTGALAFVYVLKGRAEIFTE
jgi:hypothetical protein